MKINMLAILSFSVVMQTVNVAYAADTTTLPVIAFYGGKGETDYDCEFTLTAGIHKFSDNSCPNDDVYFFKIKNPKDGYFIAIHNDRDCELDESFAIYEVRDPIYQEPTQIMSVEAGYNVLPGTEIVPGIHARAWKSGQLEGKVSCVKVYDKIRNGEPKGGDYSIPSSAKG